MPSRSSLLSRNAFLKDEELAANMSAERGYPVTVPPSREVHLLQKYRWLILMNQSGISYHPEDHYDYKENIINSFIMTERT